jgi:uncharacterized membrane protein YczE
MKKSSSQILSLVERTMSSALAVAVVLALGALLVIWVGLLSSPATLLNNPIAMAMAFVTLSFGTGAYLLRNPLIQIAGAIRTLASVEITFPLHLNIRAKA